MTVHAPPAHPRPPLPPPERVAATSTLAAGSQSPAAPSSKARKLSPPLRKALVAAHVLVGVGWLGIVVAKLVLEIVALRTGAPEAARAGFLFMQALDRAVFPPAAIATLVTGILLSVGTAWGLFRHWWIVVKLVLTAAVVVTGIVFVGAWTEAAVRSTVDVARSSASLKLIGIGIAHLVMLGTATVISVFKPWGQVRPAPRR